MSKESPNTKPNMGRLYALNRRWSLTILSLWSFLRHSDFVIRRLLFQGPHVSVPPASQHRVVDALGAVDRADQKYGDGRNCRFPEGPWAAPTERSRPLRRAHPR